MNYKRIYDELIANAINRGKPDCYTEKHHITPRCMGGEDDCSNIAILTAREHIIAHLLLCKIYKGNVSLRYAFSAMTMNANGLRNINTKYLAKSREFRSLNLKDRPPMKGMLGKNHSEETKRLISINTSKGMIGLKQSPSHVENKAKTKRKPVDAISECGTFTLHFTCASDAERLGFKRPSISRCCKNKTSVHKSYKWKFAGED